MATRLFPKNLGAAAYVVNGIAGRCDWVVLSDREPPQATLLRRVETDAPRHVFLSLREPFQALAYFMEHVLPAIQGPFVLVSGSEDATLPRQIDQRWRPFDAAERDHIQSLLGDPRLLHWFAENLDEIHPRMSPLPLGLVFPESPARPRVAVPEIPPTASRPARVLCAHRVREDSQWDLRREVGALCGGLASTCTLVEEEVAEDDFVALLHRHAFVACVSGGGLDPSPKAWQAILHGAIPIIVSGPLDAAYRQLPVVLVPRWDARAFDPDRLVRWHRRCAGHHDIPALRQETLRRLGIDYWWDQVLARTRAP